MHLALSRCGAHAATRLALPFALLMAMPGSARAQHVEMRAAVTLTGAYTQTLTNAAFPTVETYEGPSIALSPSIVGLIDTPRTTNSLGYAFSLIVPFTPTIAVTPATVTYSNRLAYSGRYELDELTTMTFGAGFLESPISTLVPSQDPTAAPVQTEPSGVAYLLTVNGNEGFSRLLTERINFTQAGSFAYGDPINPSAISAQTYSAQNTLGLTRSFPYDLVGLTLTNQFDHFTTSEVTTGAVTVVTPATSMYVNTLALNWTHPFTERINGMLSAGITQIITPDALTLMQAQPTGSATLAYTFAFTTAALAYAHAAMPNLATASVDLNDMVTLRFSTPVGVPWLIATGTAGYTHSVPILSSLVPIPGTITGPVNVYLADAALDYHPEQVPTLTVGVRGNVTRQAPVSDPDFVNTFTRYTIALNLTYSYPNWNAAAMRPQLASQLAAAPPSIDTVPTDRYFIPSAGAPLPSEEAPPEE